MTKPKLMTGKTVLITGGSDGIGKQAAKQLASMGAQVVVVGRSPAKTKAALEEIKLESGRKGVFSLIADLASLEQVRRLAVEFRQEYGKLDVLVNNAGTVFMSRQESEEGYEKTFAVNHLSHFLLTDLLLDLLKAGSPSRVVTTSSGSHLNGKIHFEDINLTRGYFIMKAYAQSKLANVMFTYELARRLEGSKVTANCLHPGMVNTNIGRDGNVVMRWIQTLIFSRGISVEEGAETLVYLASSPEAAGVTGKYFYKLKAVKTLEASYDEDAQQRLWAISEEMAGMSQ